MELPQLKHSRQHFFGVQQRIRQLSDHPKKNRYP